MSVPIAVKLWLSDHSPNLSEIGFKDGLGKVFELPYLASYELIRMWADAIKGYDLPDPGCIIV